MDFKHYVLNVTSSEWNVDEGALRRAGAVGSQAVRVVLRPEVRGGKYNGRCYDVKDTTADQIYKAKAFEGIPDRVKEAVNSTWSWRLSRDGKFILTGYRTERQFPARPTPGTGSTQIGTSMRAEGLERGQDPAQVLHGQPHDVAGAANRPEIWFLLKQARSRASLTRQRHPRPRSGANYHWYRYGVGRSCDRWRAGNGRRWYRRGMRLIAGAAVIALLSVHWRRGNYACATVGFARPAARRSRPTNRRSRLSAWTSCPRPKCRPRGRPRRPPQPPPPLRPNSRTSTRSSTFPRAVTPTTLRRIPTAASGTRARTSGRWAAPTQPPGRSRSRCPARGRLCTA